MKLITKNIIILFSALLLVFSCEKPDLTGDYGMKPAPLKGKPSPQPGYPLAETATQLLVYGVWHAGNDYCTWGSARNMTEFDNNNSWLINRGDGNPSVNLVVLSFVNPLKLLQGTTDATTLNGIPKGMTSDVVRYFTDRDIRVMLSLGGITYTDAWNSALDSDPVLLAEKAAAAAETLGVGIEIDYEENSNPRLTALETFIHTYRTLHPFDPRGEDPAARLTIDLAAGDRWLIDICRKATAEWLTVDDPVLDYANAMVPARQPSASGALSNWHEHIIGKPQYAPPILPLAPCKLTGALYINSSKPIAECVNFYSSIQYLDRDYVTRIMPCGEGNTPGMLGYMFWAAECPSTRSLCTTGKNTCTGGVGKGAEYFTIPVPMPALRPD